MNTQRKLEALVVLALVAWAAGFAQRSAAAALYASESFPSGIEVMTRGAVHEAFGGPINYNPEAGAVVVVAPPSLINELPPSERPDDPNCLWIPGYWSWDDDENAHVWVSGMWRIPPPNAVWVAGYWVQGDGGYQWTQGFWQPISVENIQYYPAPPESLEIGPSGLPPTPDSIWVPGCWRSGHETWNWEAGRWIRQVPEWVWIPSHWLRTPGGYVLVEGYWDRVPARRGMVFAPVHYRRPIYTEPNYAYSPIIVIHIEALIANLFSRPRHNHYYFGDYYGADSEYERRGIYPWYECNRPQHGWYDPIHSYEGWSHRSDESRWRTSERENYEYRRDHREARPPRTYGAGMASLQGVPDSRRPNIVMAQSLTQIINNQTINNTTVNNRTTIINRNTTSFRIVKVDTESRDRISRQDKELRKLRDERSRWETQALKGRGERNANGKKKTMELVKPLAVKPILTLFVPPTQTPTEKRNAPGKREKVARITAPPEGRPPARPDIIQVGPPPKGIPIVRPMPAPTNSPEATIAPEAAKTPKAEKPSRDRRDRVTAPEAAKTPKAEKSSRDRRDRAITTETTTDTPSPKVKAKAEKIDRPTRNVSPTPEANLWETRNPNGRKPPMPSDLSPTPSKMKRSQRETPPVVSPTSAPVAASQPGDTPQQSETKKKKKD